jgi:hypothetical protein
VSTVRHVAIADRPLVFVGLTLAGEANAPLAAMLGEDQDSASLLVVTQPRNRDERFEFAARLARVVLDYLGDRDTALRAASPDDGSEPGEFWRKMPQIIVPNQATVGFLRLLGRSTRFRRADGEYPVDPAVPVLGRWLTWLAERAEMPGSCLLLAATRALAMHWASGQSEVEDHRPARRDDRPGSGRRGRGPGGLASRGSGHRPDVRQ